MHTWRCHFPQQPEGIARCFCGEVATNPMLESSYAPDRRMKLTAKRPFANPEAPRFGRMQRTLGLRYDSRRLGTLPPPKRVPSLASLSPVEFPTDCCPY
jgi:hypothetical protein